MAGKVEEKSSGVQGVKEHLRKTWSKIRNPHHWKALGRSLHGQVKI